MDCFAYRRHLNDDLITVAALFKHSCYSAQLTLRTLYSRNDGIDLFLIGQNMGWVFFSRQFSLYLSFHRVVSFANHLDHLYIDRTKSLKLNKEIFTLPKGLLCRQRRPSNALIGIFHDLPSLITLESKTSRSGPLPYK